MSSNPSTPPPQQQQQQQRDAVADFFSSAMVGMQHYTTKAMEHMAEAIQQTSTTILENMHQNTTKPHQHQQHHAGANDAESAAAGDEEMHGWGNRSGGGGGRSPGPTKPSSVKVRALATDTPSAIPPILCKCPHTWRFLPPFFTKPTSCNYCDELLYVWEGRYPYCQRCKCCLHNKCWDMLKKQLMALDIYAEMAGNFSVLGDDGDEEEEEDEEYDPSNDDVPNAAVAAAGSNSDIIAALGGRRGDGGAWDETIRESSVESAAAAASSSSLSPPSTARGDRGSGGGTDHHDDEYDLGRTFLASTIAFTAANNAEKGFQHVHELSLTTNIVPTTCDCCKRVLLVGAAYSCTGCYFTLHKDCLPLLEALRLQHGGTAGDAKKGGGGVYAYQLDTETFLEERKLVAATNKTVLMKDATSMIKSLHDRNPKWNRAFLSPILMAKLIDKHRQRYRQLCDEVVAANGGVAMGSSSSSSSTAAAKGVDKMPVIGDDTTAIPNTAGIANTVGNASSSKNGGVASSPPPLTPSELEAALNALRFATAAYGESYRTNYMSSVFNSVMMRVVARDLLEAKDEVNNQAVVDILGLPREQLLYAKWSSLVLEPSYCCIYDRRTKTVFIVFRGSLSDNDFLSDAQGHGAHHEGSHTHAGMLKMMLKVYNDQVLVHTVRRFLKAHADYSIAITGHSLGAGLTCLFAMRAIKERLFGNIKSSSIKAYAFAPPPVASLPLAGCFDHWIYSFVCGDDMVCRLQVNSVDRLAAQIEEVSNKVSTPEAAIASSTSMEAMAAVHSSSYCPPTPPPSLSTNTSAPAKAGKGGAGGGAPIPIEVAETNDAVDDDGFISISAEDARSNNGSFAASASAATKAPPMTSELQIVGKVYFMTNPCGRPGTNALVRLERTHPLLHQIFIGADMVENHLMDTYQKSISSCLEGIKDERRLARKQREEEEAAAATAALAGAGERPATPLPQ